MIRLITPCPVASALRLIEDDPVPPGLVKFAANPRALVIAHIAAGWSWLAETPHGRAVACAGMVPAEDGALEAWLVCGQPSRKRLLGVIRAAQLTWKEIGQDGPVKIRARVAHGWRPGRRIARLLGMVHARDELGAEVWERDLG